MSARFRGVLKALLERIRPALSGYGDELDMLAEHIADPDIGDLVALSELGLAILKLIIRELQLPPARLVRWLSRTAALFMAGVGVLILLPALSQPSAPLPPPPPTPTSEAPLQCPAEPFYKPATTANKLFLPIVAGGGNEQWFDSVAPSPTAQAEAGAPRFGLVQTTPTATLAPATATATPTATSEGRPFAPPLATVQPAPSATATTTASPLPGVPTRAPALPPTTPPALTPISAPTLVPSAPIAPSATPPLQATPTATSEPTATSQPTATATATSEPTATGEPTATATSEPTATATATATATSTPTATATPPLQATPTATGEPPSPTPTVCLAEPLPLDLVLVVDRSGSIGPVLPLVYGVARSFIEGHGQHDRTGLVSFSAEPTIHSELTASHGDVAARIEQIYTDGGTDIGAGMRAALALMAARRPEAAPVIVLLTDGVNHGDDEALRQAFVEAAASGIRVIIVHLGDHAGLAPMQALAPDDTYAVAEPGALDEALKSVARSLDCNPAPRAP